MWAIEWLSEDFLHDNMSVICALSLYRILSCALLCFAYTGIEKAALAITVDNFLPDDPDIRPPAWRPIRLRRVIAKEMLRSSAAGAGGAQTADYSELVQSRPLRVMEEEELMIAEVTTYGE